jgi:multiple sugar transport system ATP-binding protein
MNFLDGALVRSERRFVSGDITLAFRSHAVSLPDGPARVVLGVRPEDVKLSVTQLEGGLPATVYVTEALGNETYVFLNLGKERIVARAGPAMRLDIESKVWISFDETKLHFFDPASGIRLP